MLFISSYNEKYFKLIYRENQNINFMFNNVYFSWKSCRLFENVQKYGRAW